MTLAAGVAGLLLPGVLSLTNAPVSSAADQETIILSVEGSRFVARDAEGEKLRTLRVLGDEAETRIIAQTRRGTPVEVHALYAIPIELPQPKSPDELEAEQSGEPVWVSVEDHKQWEGGYTDDEAQFDPSDLRPNFAYAVTPTSVTFATDSATENATKSVKVRRDAREVSVLPGARGVGTGGGQYTDTGLNPTTNYEYELTTTGPSNTLTGATLETSRTLNITTLSETKNLPSAQPMGYQYWTTAYLHETFIADARTPPLAPYENIACSAWPWESATFSGDNRSWSFPTFAAPYDTPNYRTMMFVNVNWDNPDPYRLALVKDVGATSIYINGVYTDTRYASMDNMKFDSPSASSTYAQIVLNHEGGNPFCNVGAITYSDLVRFYRSSGLVEVTGWRYPVPHHEAYARLSNAAGTEYWNTLFRRTNQGFGCLTGYCTKDNYYANVS